MYFYFLGFGYFVPIPPKTQIGILQDFEFFMVSGRIQIRIRTDNTTRPQKNADESSRQ